MKRLATVLLVIGTAAVIGIWVPIADKLTAPLPAIVRVAPSAPEPPASKPVARGLRKPSHSAPKSTTGPTASREAANSVPAAPFWQSGDIFSGVDASDLRVYH